METNKFKQARVVENLKGLGFTLLAEWDTLSFLHRHPASLGTAAQIAPLIGYESAEIAAALVKLESLGLIRRSRVYQSRRLYQISIPPEPLRRSSLVELMALAQTRTGRVLLVQHLTGRQE